MNDLYKDRIYHTQLMKHSGKVVYHAEGFKEVGIDKAYFLIAEYEPVRLLQSISQVDDMVVKRNGMERVFRGSVKYGDWKMVMRRYGRERWDSRQEKWGYRIASSKDIRDIFGE